MGKGGGEGEGGGGLGDGGGGLGEGGGGEGGGGGLGEGGGGEGLGGGGLGEGGGGEGDGGGGLGDGGAGGDEGGVMPTNSRMDPSLASRSSASNTSNSRGMASSSAEHPQVSGGGDSTWHRQVTLGPKTSHPHVRPLKGDPQAPKLPGKQTEPSPDLGRHVAG